MQAYEAISIAVITVILADTGAGGMQSSGGGPLLPIGSVYANRAPDNLAPPYLVLTPVAMADISTFTADVQTVVIQFTIYGRRDGGSTDNLAAVNSAMDRLHTLVQRVAFTVTGWGTAVGRRVGGALLDNDFMYQRSTDYSFQVQRA